MNLVLRRKAVFDSEVFLAGTPVRVLSPEEVPTEYSARPFHSAMLQAGFVLGVFGEDPTPRYLIPGQDCREVPA